MTAMGEPTGDARYDTDTALLGRPVDDALGDALVEVASRVADGVIADYIPELAGADDDATDPYFRQCALLVTTTDLALMGAMLANGGVHPLTHDRVVDEVVARDTLSLMATCGMYDRSGAWIFRVGMPAKSGVGGGIVAVKPGEFGVGVFSPPLDPAGNSSRGVALLEMLSARSGLHMFDHTAGPPSPTGAVTVDRASGVTIALRGELDFVAAEQIVHDSGRLLEHTGATTLGLDFEDVTRVAPIAERLLAATVREADAAGITVRVINAGSLDLDLGLGSSAVS